MKRCSLLQIFGVEIDGRRAGRDSFQIPGDRASWRLWYGEVRSRCGPGEQIVCWPSTEDANRKLISCAPSPYVLVDRPAVPDNYDASDGPEPEASLWVGPEFADDVSLEERFEHYAFEERNGMAYGSSF